MNVDLLIRGGHVIDRHIGLDGPTDVAVVGDRIAAVGPSPSDIRPQRTVDANGRYVVPGLIDLHTHVFPGGTFWGVDPDDIGPRTGVTTFVDAGSAGALTFQSFRAFADQRVASRVVAFANISMLGLVAPGFELANIDAADVGLLEAIAEATPGSIHGVKVRMGVPIALSHGVEPLRRAIEVAERLGVPVMCHIASAPPAIDDVLALLRPGDVITHAFTGLSMRLVDEAGRIRDAAAKARDRGVLLDVGHGSGGFSFDTAASLAAADIYPDTISTDLHQMSINGPMFDLPTCLSKFLALGMPLGDVIGAATTRPAEVIGMAGTIGTLAPGAIADIAIFDLIDGTFAMADVHHEVVLGHERLVPAMTIFGGRPTSPRRPDAPAPWIPLTARQRRFYEDPERGPALADHLSIPEDLGPPAVRAVDPDQVLREAYRAFGVPDPGHLAAVDRAGPP